MAPFSEMLFLLLKIVTTFEDVFPSAQTFNQKIETFSPHCLGFKDRVEFKEKKKSFQIGNRVKEKLLRILGQVKKKFCIFSFNQKERTMFLTNLKNIDH